MPDCRPLAHYLALDYPFNVLVDPNHGGYVVIFPDLPGCMTQADDLAELAAMAADAKALWIETEYDHGRDIPEPSYPETYSGKFNLRLPRSLHRELAEQAEREGVSLNQHVLTLLAAGNATHEVAARVEQLAARLDDRTPEPSLVRRSA